MCLDSGGCTRTSFWAAGRGSFHKDTPSLPLLDCADSLKTVSSVRRVWIWIYCTAISLVGVQIGLFRDNELIPKVGGVANELLVELVRGIGREGPFVGIEVNVACLHGEGRLVVASDEHD